MIIAWINDVSYMIYNFAKDAEWFAGYTLLTWLEISLFTGIAFRFLQKWFGTSGKRMKNKRPTGRIKYR